MDKKNIIQIVIIIILIAILCVMVGLFVNSRNLLCSISICSSKSLSV